MPTLYIHIWESSLYVQMPYHLTAIGLQQAKRHSYHTVNMYINKTSESVELSLKTRQIFSHGVSTKSFKPEDRHHIFRWISWTVSYLKSAGEYLYLNLTDITPSISPINITCVMRNVIIYQNINLNGVSAKTALEVKTGCIFYCLVWL